MNIPHSQPASEGVNPESLLNIVNVLDESCGHSVMFIRHDKIIGQGWWKPYNESYPYVLFSLSKSFLSTAICFAVQEGLLSFEDNIVKFFPDYFPSPPCENMQKAKIKHLLMMNFGRKVDLDPNFYYRKNWLEENLHVYLYYEPGTDFSYNNRTTYILSSLLQRVTGKKLVDYLDPLLFQPLGIKKPFWEEKDGVNLGRGGLNLTTEEVAKFGLFLLHRGSYNGKQLLNASLVDEMTKCHCKTVDEPVAKRPDYNSGYGYYFWMCQPEGVYRGDGACGQYLVVMPKQDMIVVITAGTLTKCQDIIQSLWDNLVGKLDESANLGNKDAIEKSQKILDQKLRSLSIPFISSSYNFLPKVSNLGKMMNCSGLVYQICQNRANIMKLSVVFRDDFDVLKLWSMGNLM